MSMNALPKRNLDVFFHHIQPKLRVDIDVIGYIYKLNDCYELMMFGKKVNEWWYSPEKGTRHKGGL